MEGLKGELLEGWVAESSRMKEGAGAGSLRSSWMERGGGGKGTASAWSFSLTWICLSG